MIVKEKGKRKNGKVWTSLLFHFSLFIFHFSLFAGHPSLTSEKDYVDEFFEIPSKFVDDLAVIPGDADFYQVLSLEDGGTWTVTTNGITVTNNVAFGPYRMVGDVYPNIPDVVKYHVGYPLAPLMSIGITPTNDSHYGWHPSIFDFAVSNSVGGYIRMTYNGDGQQKAVSQLTGDGDLYHPRSFRLDNHTYMAILSSYAAYFERLYYASEGQNNAWDAAGEWGAYGPSSDFRFNLAHLQHSADCYFDIGWTNGERTVESVRKLKEWARLKRLREIMRDDMFRSEPHCYDPLIFEMPLEASPDFVTRPGWVLNSFNGTEYVPLWWSSQANPPVIDGETIDEKDFQEPSKRGFKFFPEFDWTTEPICHVEGRYLVPSQDWSDYCVTLNMAREPKSGEDIRHPLAVLFDRVGNAAVYDYHLAADIDFILPYNFTLDNGGTVEQGLYRWLTNAYPRCVRQYYDADLAWAEYLDRCWGLPGGRDPSRRLVPNDYVGVNQLLGLMDRTIHIPVMSFDNVTNIFGHVSCRGHYKGEAVTVDVRVIDYTTHLVAELDLPDEIEFSYVSRSNSTYVTKAGVPGRTFSFSADAPSFDFRELSVHSNECAASFKIDEPFLEEYGVAGSNSMTILGVSLAPTQMPIDMALQVIYTINDGDDKTGFTGASDYFGIYPFVTSKMVITPSNFVDRVYDYDWPDTYTFSLGPTQPGQSHSQSRVKECNYGLLSWIGAMVWDNVPPYENNLNLAKANGEKTYSDRRTLETSTTRDVDDVKNEIPDLIPLMQGDRNGPRPTAPNEYAPFPESITLYPDDSIGAAVEGLRYVDFGPFPGMTFTNDEYFYVFTASSNIVHRTADVFITDNFGPSRDYDKIISEGDRIDVDVIRYYNELDDYRIAYLYITNGITHEITTNLYGTKTATTNLTSFTRISTNYYFVAGPFDEPQEKCDVPCYEVTNTVYADYGNLAVNHFTNTYFRGWDGTRSTNTPRRVMAWDREELISSRTILTNVVVSTNTETKATLAGHTVSTPTTEAICSSNRIVSADAARLVIDFFKAGDNVSNIRSYLAWTNPITHEVVTEEFGFPIIVGGERFVIEWDANMGDYTADVGGPTTNVSGTANCGIITQTDWDWKSIKRTDN